MDRIDLGRTGLTVPPLGLGTVKIGRNRDVKYPEAFDLPDDAAVTALLEAAVEEDVVLWDTAPAYGTSEERLGPFVRRHRDRLVLCTKAGEEYDARGSRFDFRREAIVRSVERSLRRLRTDVIDLVLLHSDGDDEVALVTGEAVEALERLVRRGDVRCGGVSAKTVAGIDAVRAPLGTVMAPLSGADPSREDALRRARERGLGVLAIKVLGQGHALGAEDGDPVEASLRTVWERGVAHTMVVGTRSASHLRHTAAAMRRVVDTRGADTR